MSMVSVTWIAWRGFLTAIRNGAGIALCIAYVSFSALYTFTMSSYFVDGVSSVEPLYELAPSLLALLTPALTCDLVASKRASGSIDSWLALPISFPLLLMGWLGGAWLLLIMTLGIHLIIPLILSLFIEVDWGVVIAGELGSLFIGTLFLCIGLWGSVRGRSALSAWLFAFSLCLMSQQIGYLSRILPPTLGELCQQISVLTHHIRFTRGVIDSRDLIFFFGMILFWFSLALERFRNEVYTSTRFDGEDK